MSWQSHPPQEEALLLSSTVPPNLLLADMETDVD